MPFDTLTYTDLPTALHGDVVVAMPEDEVLHYLREGRALIVKGFCQRTWGRGANGDYSIRKEEAAYVCSFGALYALGVEDREDIEPYLYAAARKLSPIPNISYITLNDTHTKDEVLAMWDLAVELRRASLLERACGGAGT